MLPIFPGSAPVYLRDLGKCLVVVGVLGVLTDVQSRLSNATDGEKAHFRVRSAVSPCRAREWVSYSRRLPSAPPGNSSGIVDPTIHVGEDEAASFHRFGDAINGTETILLRALGFVGRYVPTAKAVASCSSNSGPPRELYL